MFTTFQFLRRNTLILGNGLITKYDESNQNERTGYSRNV